MHTLSYFWMCYSLLFSENKLFFTSENNRIRLLLFFDQSFSETNQVFVMLFSHTRFDAILVPLNAACSDMTDMKGRKKTIINRKLLHFRCHLVPYFRRNAFNKIMNTNGHVILQITWPPRHRSCPSYILSQLLRLLLLSRPWKTGENTATVAGITSANIHECRIN